MSEYTCSPNQGSIAEFFEHIEVAQQQITSEADSKRNENPQN
jgi:hypothetical protein